MDILAESERDLEGIEGDKAIFKRMTNGRLKKGIGDPLDYEIYKGPAARYELETCELSLAPNPDFVSYESANLLPAELTHRYQQEHAEALPALSCEQE